MKPEDLTEGGVTEGGVTEFPGHVTVSEKAEEALSVANRELTTQEPTTTTPKEEVKGKVCEDYSTESIVDLDKAFYLGVLVWFQAEANYMEW